MHLCVHTSVYMYACMSIGSVCIVSMYVRAELMIMATFSIINGEVNEYYNRNTNL